MADRDRKPQDILITQEQALWWASWGVLLCVFLAYCCGVLTGILI